MKSFLFTHINQKTGLKEYTVVLAISTKEACDIVLCSNNGVCLVNKIKSYSHFNKYEEQKWTALELELLLNQ